MTYTMDQSIEEQYANYTAFMDIINEKMVMERCTLFKAIRDDMHSSGISFCREHVENYFWSMGLPFCKIENFTNWFMEQNC